MSTTNPTDTITEWDELQIKYGNYPERQKPITNEVISNAAIDFAESKDVLENKTLGQLQKLEDEVDEDILESYRKRRLESLKQRKDNYKYGNIHHINKAEYVNEVTEVSKANPELFVIVHLYTESKEACKALNTSLSIVAQRHGDVKFCKAIGVDVIPNFPESQTPTIIVYKNGQCIKQYLGVSVWGGDNINPDCIEYVLHKSKILKSASVEEDPRPNKNSKTKSSSSDYYVRYDFNSMENLDDDEESSEEEKERNEDRRGYSSIQMEKALRLK